jgi:hypothetical protein
MTFRALAAWRRVCANPSLANGQALLKARAAIDLKSCNVFSAAEKRSFTYNGSRWVSVDTNVGLMCPGSVEVETLQQTGLTWLYEVTDNINPYAGEICKKAAQVGTVKFDFSSWAEPAPFTCHAIEFAPTF